MIISEAISCNNSFSRDPEKILHDKSVSRLKFELFLTHETPVATRAARSFCHLDGRGLVRGCLLSFKVARDFRKLTHFHLPIAAMRIRVMGPSACSASQYSIIIIESDLLIKLDPEFFKCLGKNCRLAGCHEHLGAHFGLVRTEKYKYCTPPQTSTSIINELASVAAQIH